MSHTLANVLPSVLDDVLSDRKPIRWQLGPGPLADIRMGPERILAIAGPPGIAKTAFILQGVVDALRATPDLRALIANVEMSERELTERILCRLSGVSLGRIMDRTTTADDKMRLRDGAKLLSELGERMTFLEPPFTMLNVAQAADTHGSQLIVLDYIQRFQAGDSDEKGDSRTSMNRVMSMAREIATAGCGIIMASAVNRGPSGDYSGLSGGSMRDSSELEYGVNDAFLLSKVNPSDSQDNKRKLVHIKHRNRRLDDIVLSFRGSFQRFDCEPIGGAS